MTMHVHLKLNPNGVVAPALTALRNTLEVISICFPAIDAAEAIPSLGQGMTFNFEPNGDIQKRRPVYRYWLLSKGFHELAKGIRQSLEEACLYLEVVKNQTAKTTWGALQEQIASIKKKANDVDFPTLMEIVNAGLTDKLHFEKEFLSLNKTRNCLEHRNGIVGIRDVDQSTGVLTLALPRLKIFFHQGWN